MMNGTNEQGSYKRNKNKKFALTQKTRFRKFPRQTIKKKAKCISQSPGILEDKRNKKETGKYDNYSYSSVFVCFLGFFFLSWCQIGEVALFAGRSLHFRIKTRTISTNVVAIKLRIKQTLKRHNSAQTKLTL